MGTNATAGGGNPSAAARRRYDVAVIGGGPAGAAVARGLALRGRDVVLLEASAFDAPRFGETIAPEANPLLRELGVWAAFAASSAVESPGTISAWGSPVPSETDFLRNAHGSGRHVDRNAFDAMLCSAAAEAGAHVRTSVRVVRCDRERCGDDVDDDCGRSGDGVDGDRERSGDDVDGDRGRSGDGVGDDRERSRDGVDGRRDDEGDGRRDGECDGDRDGEGDGDLWRVTTSGGVFRARFVIDASGRNGVRLGADDRRVVDDALIGIFARVAHDEPAPADLRTLVESVPDGWWYCAPLPSGETVAVFLTDPELYANDGIVLGEQLAVAPLTRARIGAARIIASHVVHVPSSARARAAGHDWAAAGDAAAAYDPLSGYGITKALDDARVLTDATHAALNGERLPLAAYAERICRAFDAYAAQRREYYALERRWPNRTFWKNRLELRPARGTR